MYEFPCTTFILQMQPEHVIMRASDQGVAESRRLVGSFGISSKSGPQMLTQGSRAGRMEADKRFCLTQQERGAASTVLQGEAIQMRKGLRVDCFSGQGTALDLHEIYMPSAVAAAQPHAMQTPHQLNFMLAPLQRGVPHPLDQAEELR